MPPAAKKPTYALWIVTVLVALTFLVTGVSKLASIPPSPANFARWGLSPTIMHCVGAVEVISAIALLVPRASALAAIFLIVAMFGAIETGVTHHEPMHVVLPAVLIVLLAVVAFGRRDPILRAIGRRER